MKPAPFALKLQESWARLVERLFGEAAADAARDEMARGEFTSAFVTDTGRANPRPGEERRRPRTAP